MEKLNRFNGMFIGLAIGELFNLRVEESNLDHSLKEQLLRIETLKIGMENRLVTHKEPITLQEKLKIDLLQAIMYFQLNNESVSLDLCQVFFKKMKYSAYDSLSLSFMVNLIHKLLDGKDLLEAIYELLNHINQKEDSKFLRETIKRSLEENENNAKDVFELHEIIGVALKAVLSNQSHLNHVFVSTVAHEGNKELCGMFTGLIVGAFYGLYQFPIDWVEKLEHRDELLGLGFTLNQKVYINSINHIKKSMYSNVHTFLLS